MVLALCVLGVQAAEVVWYDGHRPITYSVPKKVESVVKVALELWKNDMQQVTGLEPIIVNGSRAKIILRQSKKLPADGFRISVKGGQIIIEGSNGRGMAYGLLELSRMAGVSPWIWWGDVVPEKKTRLTINEDYVTEQSPSVEYRGIFINDEDWSLRPWSNYFEKGQKGQIGPKTYRKIFELLLRLRANAIWPAMHTGTTAFFKIPGAKAMADSCGIVIGTSHCEPLLRNNVDEWDVKQRGAFNYKTNREQVQQYWIERLQEVSKSKDNMFTIGMRGIHDGSMEGYKTTQEKLVGLQQVIDDQQELLRKYIGAPEQQMQVFVPYKEVLELYEKGLEVPDYVTLMWCDDNYGYMTRLSNAEEQQRMGGGGVYYHLSYWGRPHDYLWLTTTQPGLIYNEMREAYDHNVRKLWIVNVHDPKVAGYDLELFLDMAWNIDCVSGETLNNHYQSWLCRQFGDQVGERLFPVMHEYYRLCGERRPEFMGYTQVELDKKKYNRGLSPVSEVPLTPQEATVRLEAFERLKATVIAVRPHVRPELADAFFAAIEYPVFATAAMNRKILSDSVESHRAYEEIQSLTKRYNEMNGGKWRYLMDAAPRQLPVFEDVRASLMKQGEASSCINACDYVEASERVKTIQMLGHSMNAVALPKDGRLTYRLEVEKAGDYTLQTALIPTQPNDNGDLRYSVSVDGGKPTVFSLKEPFRSEEWKQNVLRGQALRQLKAHLSAGQHTLTIRALDAHIIIDQFSCVAEDTPRMADGIIDTTDTNCLGLPKSEHVKTVHIFSAKAKGDHYANGVVMAAFKNKLYCMWQSSLKDEDSDDTKVVYSTSSDDGMTWSRPKTLAAATDKYYSTSGGWLVNGDTLTAFIDTWEKGLEPRGGRTCYITSTDGKHWSSLNPVTMVDGNPMEGVLEQDPYKLPEGRLVGAAHFMPGLHVCPVYTDDVTGHSGWKKAVFQSEDKGKQSRELEPSQYVQEDGTVVMLFRDQSSTFRKLASVSKDRGETWSKPEQTNIPDARTKQCAGNLPDGTSYMVSCPANDKTRWPLVLLTSRDGKTFDKALLLRSGERTDLPPRRYEGKYKTLGYSYPKAMIHNGKIYVGYSTNKEDVDCTIIPIE